MLYYNVKCRLVTRTCSSKKTQKFPFVVSWLKTLITMYSIHTVHKVMHETNKHGQVVKFRQWNNNSTRLARETAKCSHWRLRRNDQKPNSSKTEIHQPCSPRKNENKTTQNTGNCTSIVSNNSVVLNRNIITRNFILLSGSTDCTVVFNNRYLFYSGSMPSSMNLTCVNGKKPTAPFISWPSHWPLMCISFTSISSPTTSLSCEVS